MTSGSPVLRAEIGASTDVLDAAILAADATLDRAVASMTAKAKAIDAKLSSVGGGFGAGLEGNAAKVDAAVTSVQARINGMFAGGGGDAKGSAEFFSRETDRVTNAVRALAGQLDPAVAILHRYEDAQAMVARAVNISAINQEQASRIIQQAYREFETSIDALGGGAGRLEAQISSVQARINGMFAGSGGSAQASAEFFRETEQATNAVRALQAQMDPAAAALHRFEAAQRTLADAVRLGAIQQAEADRTMVMVQQRYAAVSGVIARAPASYRNIGAAAQQAGYQVGDFAVQVASGQNPIVAFTQQASQLLGFFGPFGAVMGAAAAIAGGLAVAFWDVGDGAKATDKATKDLAKSVTTYRKAAEEARLKTGELAEKYGELGTIVQEINARMAEVARVQTVESIDKAFKALSETVSGVTMSALRDTVAALDRTSTAQERAAARVRVGTDEFARMAAVLADLRDEFDTDNAGALKIAEAMDALSSAKGPEDQARAANDMAAALLEVYGSYEKMPGPAREVYTRVQETAEKAADAAGAVGALGSNLSRSAEGAALLRDRMREVAEASAAAAKSSLSARRVAELKLEYKSDPVGLAGKLAAEEFDAANKVTQDMNPFFVAGIEIRRNAVIADAEATARAEKALSTWKSEVKSGASASKSAAKDIEKLENSVTDTKDKLEEMTAASLAEREAIGLTGDALARHNAVVEAAAVKQDLLNKAAKEGLKISPQQLADVDALAAGYVAAAVATEKLSRSADEAKARNKELSDAFGQAIGQADSFADAIKNLAVILAQGLIFGEGPAGKLANSIGGSLASQLGNALGSYFGTSSAAPTANLGTIGAGMPSIYAADMGAGLSTSLTPRAGGGEALAGRSYWTGELGPEPFIPEVNGRILSVAQSQAALRSSVGGGVSRTELTITLDDDGRLANIARKAGADAAGPVAVKVTRAAMKPSALAGNAAQARHRMRTA